MDFTKTAVLVLGCSIAGWSCGGAVYPPLKTVPSKENFLEDPSHTLVAGALEDVAAIEKLVVATRGVIASEDFMRALSYYTDLTRSVGGGDVDGVDVYAAYLRPSNHTIPLKTVYTLLDTGCARQTAATGVRAELAGATWESDPGTLEHPGLAATDLNRCTVQRAKSAAVGQFACAVNTIAHEWTHSVVNSNNNYDQEFQDSGHNKSRTGLVSYTVGAIAQCVYLQQHAYRVYDPANPSTIDGCVTAIGKTFFDPDTCSDAWVEGEFGPRDYARYKDPTLHTAPIDNTGPNVRRSH